MKFTDKIRDLRWEDIPDIAWNWARDLAHLYWLEMGWYGAGLVFLAVVFALLMFDMTHHMTSLVLARALNSIWMLTLGGAVILLGIGFKYLGFTVLAKARDSARRLGEMRWRPRQAK